jgi:hypothetical protein
MTVKIGNQTTGTRKTPPICVRLKRGGTPDSENYWKSETAVSASKELGRPIDPGIVRVIHTMPKDSLGVVNMLVFKPGPRGIAQLHQNPRPKTLFNAFA